MSQECQICCIDYNTNVFVDCIGCESQICRPCHQRYILDSNQPAHCMACRSKWNHQFLYKIFTKTWVNKTYRDHIKSIALDREKSRIPETLAILPRERRRVERKERLKELKERRKNLKAELSEVNDEIRRIENPNYYRWRNPDEAEPDQPEEEIEEHLNFICPCPDEECRGMIESKSFKCGVCDQKVCRRCRVARHDNDNHECKEEDIETMKLLRKDTKPCPKCAVPIYRLSGCRQMYCTQCHVVFDWVTGNEEHGVVHNPHALQWQRQHGGLMRDINDIPCGGLANVYELILYFPVGSPENDTLRRIHRFTGELDYTLNGCHLANFEELRLQYVLNKITEQQWRQKIFLIERSNARKQTVRDILTNFRTLVVERIRNLWETCQANYQIKYPNINLNEYPMDQWGRVKFPKEGSRYIKVNNKVYEKFAQDMEVIRKFTNDALNSELPPLGTTSPHQINDEWRWNSGGYWWNVS